MKANDLIQLMAHFPQTMSQELAEFTKSVVFLSSRYLFVWRVGLVQMAYCTHCQTEYPIGVGQASYKHNEKTTCLHCSSECVVKSHGRGRSKLVDDAYFVWYEKSLVNPMAIVAFGIQAKRDYRGDYRDVHTTYSTRALYLFEPSDGKDFGSIRMINRNWREQWEEKSSVHSIIDTEMKYKKVYLAAASVESAVVGTPFQYSMWNHYRDQSYDLVKFFDLAARYPCVEYLTKLGLRRIVEAKLTGQNTYRVVNWRGRTIEKVLRLSKPEIKQLRNSNFSPTPLSLHSYHHFKQRRLGFTFEQAHLLRDFADSGYTYYTNMLNELSGRASIERILGYLLKQTCRPGSRFSSATYALTAWRDYIGQCQELGMDLTKEHLLFPNDLHKAHQMTTEKVRIKADEALNIMIADRLKDLEKFVFEFNGLILRPAASSHELFHEGKELNHCVGRYSQNYAEGKTNLFLVRTSEDPDVPFYTVEVFDGKILQARGKLNCAPTEEVEAFLEAFTTEKLRKKRKKKMVQVTEQVGVAV